MEKELVVLYEAAKKAADAAASVDAGSAEESLCIDALRELKDVPVNYKILVDTQVGKRLRHLTKHPRKKIQAFAAELIGIWKDIIIEETTRNQKNGSDGEAKKRPNSAASGKASDADTVKREKKVKSDSSDKKTDSVKIETGNSMLKQGPPKLTSMVMCNDQARDNVRRILFEALSKVRGEVDETLRSDVEACDPIRVAVAVESVMFEKWGGSTGPQKAKYRSIIFNLKDQKNPDFRRRVLLGHLRAEDIPSLSPEDMASDQRKMENKQIKEKALFECERGLPSKATTDQFKCGRCKQRKCTYYQLQTRSADEPMTTFVTCVNCNNHWKFC